MASAKDFSQKLGHVGDPDGNFFRLRRCTPGISEKKKPKPEMLPGVSRQPATRKLPKGKKQPRRWECECFTCLVTGNIHSARATSHRAKILQRAIRTCCKGHTGNKKDDHQLVNYLERLLPTEKERELRIRLLLKEATDDHLASIRIRKCWTVGLGMQEMLSLV